MAEEKRGKLQEVGGTSLFNLFGGGGAAASEEDEPQDKPKVGREGSEGLLRSLGASARHRRPR